MGGTQVEMVCVDAFLAFYKKEVKHKRWVCDINATAGKRLLCLMGEKRPTLTVGEKDDASVGGVKANRQKRKGGRDPLSNRIQPPRFWGGRGEGKIIILRSGRNCKQPKEEQGNESENRCAFSSRKSEGRLGFRSAKAAHFTRVGKSRRIK